MKGKVFYWLILGLAACQKDSPPPPVSEPGKAVLVFPEQNSVCMEGRVISAEESAVDFRWSPSEYTDTYELTIKNLITAEVRTAGTAESHLEVVLGRNAPYSWYVTSKSRQTGVAAQSDVFRFYNAGPGAVSYAPFPAEILLPVMGQSVPAGQVTLDWNGSDADGDLAVFDVYFGTSPNPDLFLSGLQDSKLEGVPVQANTVYFWRVISRDGAGNTSDSGVFRFSVN